MDEKDKELKISFIGYGNFSKVRHHCLKKLRKINVVGFYDPYQDDEFEIPKFNNLQELFINSDAIIVSVPPQLAPQYVIQALSQHKKVFCEKPAAVSIKELQKIEPYLGDFPRQLAYGFNHRQHSSVNKIKTIIDSGQFGRILWMRGRYGKQVDANYVNTWRCDCDLNGGGIVIDQGIHMIDLIAYLAGGFDSAQAVLSDSYLKIKGIEDNGFITLFSKKSRISASIHSTVSQWRYLFSLEVYLEKGSMTLNGLKTNSGNYGDEVLTIKPCHTDQTEISITEIKYNTNDSWEKEMIAFVDSVRHDTEYKYANYIDAVNTTNLLDLIYREAIWI